MKLTEKNVSCSRKSRGFCYLEHLHKPKVLKAHKESTGRNDKS